MCSPYAVRAVTQRRPGRPGSYHTDVSPTLKGWFVLKFELCWGPIKILFMSRNVRQTKSQKKPQVKLSKQFS